MLIHLPAAARRKDGWKIQRFQAVVLGYTCDPNYLQFYGLYLLIKG